MKIRIVCLSDTHNQHRILKVPEGDIVIHAGDITNAMNNSIRTQKPQVLDFCDWYGRLPHKHKIISAGNHDFAFEGQGLPKDEAIDYVFDHNITYLENTGTEVMGLKIYGSPVTPTFGNWAFNVDRGPKIRRIWENIPKDTDILITHGPPHGILDLVLSDHEHVGCRDLLKKVYETNVKIHVFGHIHCSAGIHEDFMFNKLFINAACADSNYDMVRKPVVIDYDTDSLEISVV